MSFNFSQLIAFQKKLQKLDKQIQEKVCKDVVNGLASYLVEYTKLRTPVGHYPKNAKDKNGTKKRGGVLRRGWKAKGFKIPHGYEETVFNDVEYAPYVEYGHRIVYGDKTVGFVEGRHMLEKSIDEVRKTADSYANRKADETIRRILGNWKIK